MLRRGDDLVKLGLQKASAKSAPMPARAGRESSCNPEGFWVVLLLTTLLAEVILNYLV
jgi:hypothetical protein